jgi:hypothetical protein
MLKDEQNLANSINQLSLTQDSASITSSVIQYSAWKIRPVAELIMPAALTSSSKTLSATLDKYLALDIDSSELPRLSKEYIVPTRSNQLLGYLILSLLNHITTTLKSRRSSQIC